jgi:NOL1/NOP2/fmu family ribosome biogenesis protein
LITIIKKSERKKILNILKKRFGFEDLKKFYILKSGKNRIRLMSKDFERVNLKGMRIKFMGLEFGLLTRNEKIRLTIEGSQIIEREATKNILKIGEEAAEKWMIGKTPFVKGNKVKKGYVIIKHKNDILGCGRYSKGKIWSFVPKWRRVEIFD